MSITPMKRWPIVTAAVVGAAIGFLSSMYVGMAIGLATSLTTAATVVVLIVCPVMFFAFAILQQLAASAERPSENAMNS